MIARSRKVVFTNAAGHELSGRLDLPAGEPIAQVLYAHCFTCSKDNTAASRLARALAAQGVAVLRFDFTGLGDSGGDFADTNFSSNVTDLECAADFLRRKARAPRILIGHSLGGAAVLAAASRLREVELVATINAPADVRHLSRLFHDQVETIEAQGEACVLLEGRAFRIQKQFLDDLRAENLLEEKIAALRKALIIFHAPGDETVSITHAGEIYRAARHPKSFVALDGADHMLTRKEDVEYVAAVVSAWARRYLPSLR